MITHYFGLKRKESDPNLVGWFTGYIYIDHVGVSGGTDGNCDVGVWFVSIDL